MRNSKEQCYTTMPLTIQELQEKLLPIVGKPFNSPITRNKGATGLLLETITGIPHTPNCLDCEDGELKTFPVKRLKDGTLVPKETLAVTMVSLEDLKDISFSASRCCKKMSRMLIVPYLREGDTILYLKPTLLEKEKNPELYTIFEEDYHSIQREYVGSGTLKSEFGKYLQTRTKGAGHGTTTRAFYLRTSFLKEHIVISRI
jgi:DNA mismatch repair protein MutH